MSTAGNTIPTTVLIILVIPSCQPPTDQETYLVTTRRDINNAVKEFRKRKPSHSIPSVSRSHPSLSRSNSNAPRPNPFLAPSPDTLPTTDQLQVPPEIHEQRDHSLLKVGGGVTEDIGLLVTKISTYNDNALSGR